MTTPPRNPILGLPDRLCRVLHIVSLVWIAAALVVLEVAGSTGRLDHRPGQEAFDITARPAFIALFAIGAVLAWRWEILGGTLSAFTSAALIVWSIHQLELPHAVTVVSLLAIPGLIWVLLDLHDQRPVVALLGLVIVVGAGLVGITVGERLYDDIFGASHPASTTAAPASSDIDWIWTGAVTESSATVTAKVDDKFRGQSIDAIARPDASAPGRAASGSATDDLGAIRTTSVVDDHDVVSFDFDHLISDQRYTVTLSLGDHQSERRHDDPSMSLAEDSEARGTSFSTFPTGPASFTIAAGGCARVGSNGAVFDAIAAVDPALFIATGDFHYGNIGENDPDKFREVLDYTLSRPAQAALYRETPVAYVWDDHDYGANNADRSSPSRPAAWQVYREYVPHYPLADDDAPIYQALTIGRVRVILTDVRSARTPSTAVDDADKSMLGVTQKAWLKDELLAADERYALTIWVNPVPWIGDAEAGLDDWRGYSTERAELADFIADNGLDSLLMLSGDAHMVAIDDGTNTNYAASGGDGFPLLHAAALDRPGRTKGGPYSHGAIGGGGQFGVIDITDAGSHVTITLSGLDWEGNELLTHRFEVPAASSTDTRR